MGCEQRRVGWDGSRGSDRGVGCVQETVKLEYTSWWGTKVCSRGGKIFGNHRGTGLTDAVEATHSVIIVAVLAVSLRSPTAKKVNLLASGAKQNSQSHQVSVSRRGIRPPSLGV